MLKHPGVYGDTGIMHPDIDGERGTSMSASRAATIEDVAREAGVSRAAVSKVIRNAYGVSPAMRERVNAAIEALDYRPRIAARAMRGSSFTLGIELPSIGNPFFTKIVAGATAALHGTPYQLIIAPADMDNEEGVRALGALADRQVDGIVAISPKVRPEWLERLAGRVPVVMIGRHDRPAAYDTVTDDDVLGTRLAMQHLFDLGHRRIAHLTRDEEVTVPGSGTPHAVRLEQYLALMEEAGLSEHIRVVRTGLTEESARLDTHALLDEGVPTAIFAGNDELAFGAQRALGERGLTPADVSLVGYDDVDIASHPAISLTTVHQSGEALGERAIRLLLERIQGRSEPANFTVVPSLEVRASTAPANAEPTD
jgi:LacI family transcriptional regulator